MGERGMQEENRDIKYLHLYGWPIIQAVSESTKDLAESFVVNFSQTIAVAFLRVTHSITQMKEFIGLVPA